MHTKNRIRKFCITALTSAILAVQLMLVPASALPVQAAPVTFPDGTVFDPEYYAETYPDVRAVFGNDAVKLWLHYYHFGMKEGRRGAAPGTTPSLPATTPSAAQTATAPAAAAPAAVPSSVTFDPAFYAARYPDVRAAFGNDAAKLWLHYRMFGEKEKRQAAANYVPGIKVDAPKGVAELAIPKTAGANAAQPAALPAPVFKPGGKRVAFVGDSITTYAGQIPSTYATYYPHEGLNQLPQTWWYQVMMGGGMQLAVNASWSGSCVTGDRNDTSGAVGSGLGRVRTVVAAQPNIVFVTMGVNDFGWSKNPEQFRECYNAMIRQFRTNLPHSLIICCTCFPQFLSWQNEGGYTIEEYNSVIRRAAGENGCYLIDTATCGLNRSQMIDEVHPNATGATVVANYILAHMPPIK
ncbi:MAG: SGNH/GDSL hydrolase family protein [Lachnospiraceae bacterium]|nr:SGNH/GDSL hydrolase family protein [Lachnospiraceae bacterium]